MQTEKTGISTSDQCSLILKSRRTSPMFWWWVKILRHFHNPKEKRTLVMPWLNKPIGAQGQIWIYLINTDVFLARLGFWTKIHTNTWSRLFIFSWWAVCRKLNKENKKLFCVLANPHGLSNLVKIKDFQPRHLTELARICPLFWESGSKLLTEDRIVKRRHAE